MRDLSAVSRWNEDAKGYELRLDVNNVVFPQSRIVSLEIHRELFAENKLSVGGACVGEIKCTLIAESAEIPRMAALEPYVRKVLSNGYSGWVKLGLFYIDTRVSDPINGTIELTGYDRILMAEQQFLTAGDQGQWPRTDIQIVDEICTRIGVDLDTETENLLTQGFLIQYPNTSETAERGGYTCRELLGIIAGMYCGNWTITADGDLRLVTLAELPEYTRLLADENYNVITFGAEEVAIIV